MGAQFQDETHSRGVKSGGLEEDDGLQPGRTGYSAPAAETEARSCSCSLPGATSESRPSKRRTVESLSRFFRLYLVEPFGENVGANV